MDAGVLSSQYSLNDANQVAQTVQKALASVPQAKAPMSNAHPQSDFRAFTTNGGRLDEAAIGSQSWSYDVQSGKPQFRALLPEEASALIAEANALPGVGASIFGSLVDAWGAVFSAITHGVAIVKKIFVNAGQVALTLAIEGGLYVFKAVISLVSQALDLVEEVFTTVGVFFENLFKWLGYIFNWQNILRTHQAVVYAVNQSLDFFQEAAAAVKKAVDASLLSFANNEVANLFAALEKQLGASTTIGQYQASNAQSLGAFDSPSARIMNTHLQQNSANATPTSSTKATGVTGSIQKVVDELSNLMKTYGASQEMKDAQQFFAATLDSPDNYLQLALSGILALAKAAVLALLGGVQLLVDAVLDAVADLVSAMQGMFNQEWNIPIVSDLYLRMTTSTTNPNGLPLSGLSLLGLLAAMPATVVYTVVTGAAPFPDDASLAAFESAFTSSTFLQNSGLGGAAQPAPRAPAAEPSQVNVWAAILGFLLSGIQVANAYVDAMLDLQLPETVSLSAAKWVPKQLSPAAVGFYTYANLLLQVCGIAFSIPWVSGPKSWGPNTHAAWECYLVDEGYS